jgi:hypothetical protein
MGFRLCVDNHGSIEVSTVLATFHLYEQYMHRLPTPHSHNLKYCVTSPSQSARTSHNLCFSVETFLVALPYQFQGPRIFFVAFLLLSPLGLHRSTCSASARSVQVVCLLFYLLFSFCFVVCWMMYVLLLSFFFSILLSALVGGM